MTEWTTEECESENFTPSDHRVAFALYSLISGNDSQTVASWLSSKGVPHHLVNRIVEYAQRGYKDYKAKL